MNLHLDSPPTTIPGYQIRIRLLDIDPIIWRRFLLRSDATFAILHHTIQIAFGWQQPVPYRFKLRSATIGWPHTQGHWTSEDAAHTLLCVASLHERQRFNYQSRLRDGWNVEVRAEKLIMLDDAKLFPRCIGGKRAAPPEICQGHEHFLWLREQYTLPHINRRLLATSELLQLAAGEEDDWQPEIEASLTELATLQTWLRLDQFNRREVNRQLRAYATGHRHLQPDLEHVP